MSVGRKPNRGYANGTVWNCGPIFINQSKQNRTMTNDPVNHPAHYTSHPSGVECIEITRHYCFAIGNAIKYLWRAGLKQDADKTDRDKEIEDMRKAVWYINDRIKQLEGAPAHAKPAEEDRKERLERLDFSIEYYKEMLRSAPKDYCKTKEGQDWCEHISSKLAQVSEERDKLMKELES